MLVDLAPVINQVVLPLATTGLIACASWAAARVARLAHIQLQDSQRRVLSAAITNGLAYAETLLAGKEGVTVNDKVATALNYVLPKVPGALKSLNVTPEHLAQVITAQLPTP